MQKQHRPPWKHELLTLQLLPKRIVILETLLLLLLLLLLLIEPSSHASSTKTTTCDRSHYAQPWQLRSDQLTVLISGFSPTRMQLLKTLARSYSAAPCVDSVHILWFNNATTDPAAAGVEFESAGAPVHIHREASSSLNGRFLPRPFIRTRAVAVADDDVEIDPATACFALRVWNGLAGGRRILGFFARSHDFDFSAGSWIYTVHPDRFSIVLTKFMILPTELLFAYSCEMDARVRVLVERNRNCEDIAMNFLAAERARAGPLLVRGRLVDRGDTRNENASGIKDVAISGIEGHRGFRGFCIREFHRIWGKMPLRYSTGVVVNDVIREQALCRKAGSLVRCDEEVGN